MTRTATDEMDMTKPATNKQIHVEMQCNIWLFS